MTHNMKTRRRVLPLLLTIIAVSSALPQFSVNSVSVSVGAIRSLGIEGREYKYVAYPEVQLGGECLLPFLGWSAYWGYWDDGVEHTDISDQIAVSTHGHIVGARIAFFPKLAMEQWPLPIALFGGLAHQFISYNIIEGYYPALFTPFGAGGSNTWD